MRENEADDLTGEVTDPSVASQKTLAGSKAGSGTSQDFSVDQFSVDSDALTGSIGEIENVSAGQTIGRYKLLRVIGAGGMGAVWLAEQTEPVSRRVALKLIRAEINSKSKIARFEAERQAIAIMDHPNIAKIHDAGTTPGGNPYFVMELVKGVPLNEFCDKRKLTVKQRLELMLPILSAVQHAHQKAIIHRDLKHSNVLVTESDNPTPKVIDFGLAKTLGHHQTLTDKTLFTEIGAVVGTLQYMSPEQASDDHVDIDTRADVYALGVMIYKLLTGTTPLLPGRRNENSVVGMLEKIRNVDPPTPSARLAEFPDELDRLAGIRSTSAEKLVAAVEGDLDWIVMKALDKDRRLRYDSASSLAAEIKRFLNDETVLARPPSSIYVAKKFIRRNRGLVASIASIISLLTLGIVATTLTTLWALNESNDATLNLEKANKAASDMRIAMNEAKESEQKVKKLQADQAIELHAYRMKQAWNDWNQGNVEAAWQKLDESKDYWETRFLRTQFASSKRTLHGHSGGAFALDASKDGKYFASAAEYDSAIVWSAENGQKLHEWQPDDEATCIRFSPDSSMVACSTRSNTITVWSLSSGKEVKTFGPFKTDVTCFDFCGTDGDSLVVGYAKLNSKRKQQKGREYFEVNADAPLLQIVSFEDGEVIEQLTGHEDSITGVDCSSDGGLIVSSSVDSTAKVWQKKDGQFTEAGSLSHSSPVLAIALSPSNGHVVTGLENNNVCLWHLKDQKLIRAMSHKSAVTGVAFSNDETKVASASRDRTAKIWSVGSGAELVNCRGHFYDLRSVVFSHDDSEIVTASEDSTVRVWNAAQNGNSLSSMTHDEIIWGVALTADQKQAVSVSQDGSFAITDLGTGNVVVRTNPTDFELLCVATSPTQPLFATGGSDCKVRIWNSRTGSQMSEFKAHKSNVWNLNFSPDGKFLVSSSEDGLAVISDTVNWKSIASLDHNGLAVTSARFSHDGRYILTGCDDSLVRIWDSSSFELVSKLAGHQYPIWRAIFSPDDKLIASSGYNGEVLVWDVELKTLLRKMEGHRVEVAGLAFTTDGSRLFSASDDGTIRIWDVNSGIELFELWEQDSTQSVSVCISEDGRKLVSGSGKGRLTIRTTEHTSATTPSLRPNQVDEFTLAGTLKLLDPDLSSADTLLELETAAKCCQLFPYYSTWANLGMAQCQLGKYAAAETSLRESIRLEKIQYGFSDLAPYAEGHLAIVLANLGDIEGAKKFHDVFTQKLGEWEDQPWAKQILKEYDRLANNR